MGPNSFDSRSNCEPTRMAREPSSGAPLGVLAGSPLYLRVQKPGGTGELEPMISAMRRTVRTVRPVAAPGSAE